VNKSEFLEIVDRYLNGKTTPEEDLLLKRYYESFQNNNEWNEAELGNVHEQEAVLLNKLKEALRQNKSPVQKLYSIRRLVWPVAAAIILLIGISYLVVVNSKRQQQVVTPQISNQKPLNDLLPGGNKAVLTLADGSSIVLDSARNGKLGNQGNSDIVKIKSGEIAYNNIKQGEDKPVYNIIATPKGGQYQVTLSDGTMVWLNAASSLRFPTSFVGDKRRVEISGEAYFEVAKNKEKPFVVKANGSEIEVLGTHFNVNAYQEEETMKTTLLEGSVKVTNGGGSSLLKPGQQSVIDKNNSNVYVKTEVNMDEVMAWKNGRFIFNDADLPSVMREIARWYDVEVVYEGNSPTDHFTGKMSRNMNASDVLKILSLSDEHFRIEGRRIIVTSNKK